MKYDSLILDIDGTIWNTTPIVATAWNDAVDQIDCPAQHVTAEMLTKEFGKPMDVIAMDLWPNLDKETQQKILDICCINEHKAIELNQTDITYPTVIETVKKLAGKIPVYVVSNCQAGYIQLTLKKTGLTDCVKDFVCFGDNEKSKGENIQLIVERNNLKNPVYVGDTQGDCDSCKMAKVPFVWAKYGFGTADEYVLAVEQFSEIEKLF